MCRDKALRRFGVACALLLVACGPRDFEVEQTAEAEVPSRPSMPGPDEPLVDLSRGTVSFHGQVGLNPCPLPDLPNDEPADGPNVLLIAVDTLRADHLGFLGYERDTSPYLDALAEESWVFEHAVAPAPWTLPSMAAVLTGRPPAALGIGAEPVALPVEVPTLAERLRDRGYLTVGLVSHFYVGEKYGFHRGFDVWDQTGAGSHTKISSPWITGMAGRCLEAAAERERPFFLFVHYFDPHYDYLRHPEYPYYEGYDGPVRSRGDNFESLRVLAEKGRLEEADFAHLKDLYDSEIAFTDEHVGRLLTRLRQLGLYDETLIVFVADHGEMFGERPEQWLGHTRAVFEELVHVPLLVKPPSGADARRIAETVSTESVSPTILEMLGVDGVTDFMAPSLVPVAAGEPAGLVFTQTQRWRKFDAVYQDRWKLVADRRTFQEELFDLREDPGETEDRSASRIRTMAVLKKELERRREEVEAAAAKLSPREEPELSDEERAHLEALGYVD